jgi:hypothetical protein
VFPGSWKPRNQWQPGNNLDVLLIMRAWGRTLTEGKEICYVDAISQKRYNYIPCVRAGYGCDTSSDVAEEISDCLLDYRKAHVSVGDQIQDV